MNRWYTNPEEVFAAEIDGQILGVNIALNWGHFGLFSPLVVHPDFGSKVLVKN